MRYLVLFILVCASIWYFFIRTDVVEKPPEPVRVETPAEQFQKIISAKTADASALGALCSAHPQLAAQFLKNRSVTLTGTIEDFRLSGMDGRRADVYLRTGAKLRIVISFDLDRYSRLSVNERESGKYTSVDTELLWVTQNGTNKRRIFMKEERLTQRAVFKSVGATNVNFNAILQ